MENTYSNNCNELKNPRHANGCRRGTIPVDRRGKRSFARSKPFSFFVFLLTVVVLWGSGRTDASAQPRKSERIKPRWMQQLPKPSNATFTYEIKTAQAASLEEARDKCLTALVVHSGLENGVVAISGNLSEEHLSQVYTNGKLVERIEYDSHTTTRLQAGETKLYVAFIAEYWEKDRFGTYYATELYARSGLNREPLFDAVESTTRYGGRGLWRSAVIPGWGQFYKGSTLKGCLVLSGCAVLAGGIVFTGNQRSDYIRKRNGTHDINLIRRYTTRADHFTTARNICIGAAAALYLYNLIDAVAAPGARRITTKSRRGPGRSYAVAPSFLEGEAAGLTASVVF